MKRRIVLIRRAHTENHNITSEGISKAIERAKAIADLLEEKDKKIAVLSSTDNVAMETSNLLYKTLKEVCEIEIKMRHINELLGSYVMNNGYAEMLRKIFHTRCRTVIAVSHATVLENSPAFFENEKFREVRRSFGLYPEPLDYIIFSNF